MVAANQDLVLHRQFIGHHQTLMIVYMSRRHMLSGISTQDLPQKGQELVNLLRNQQVLPKRRKTRLYEGQAMNGGIGAWIAY